MQHLRFFWDPPVGIFAQLGRSMLGDDACAEGMAFVEFPRGDGFDGDAGQTEFVDVVAQYGIFFVFGGRAEGDVHAQAYGQIVVDFVCAVDVGRNRGFGDFAAFRTLDGNAGKVGGGIRFITDAWKYDIGVDGNLAAVEFGQAGGVVEDGRCVGGFCGGGIRRALRVDRLCAEVVAGGLCGCGGKGSAEQQDGFFQCGRGHFGFRKKADGG